MRILSYGEALVDFLPDRAGVPLRDVETFRKTVGGAPANAAVGLARLGCDVGLLGKVGEDEFGHFLMAALRREGVDVSGVGQTREAKTGITFVSLDHSGDRSFLFFREPSADLTLRVADVDESVIDACEVLVAGSNLLTQPGIREATYHVLEHARSTGRFVVLDPNVRLHLWPVREEADVHVRRQLGYGDVVKVNEEELRFLRADESADALWAELADDGLSALIVTLAGAGARVYWPGGTTSVDAPETDVVDTTGAGDGFVAGLVCGLTRLTDATDAATLRATVRAADTSLWRRVLRLGCHVGTSVCEQYGATPALPFEENIPWSEFGR